MKVLILVSFVLILSVFSRCSSKPILTFEELLENVPPQIDGRQHESAIMNYSIELKKQMQLKENVYNDSSYYELFISGELYSDVEPNILSIYKFYSNQNSLEDVWFTLTKNRINFENSNIRSQGLTDFMISKSYYEHATLLLSDERIETVSFLFNEIDSIYYVVTLYASVENDYPNNLLGLLYSLKTFSYLSKPESKSLQQPLIRGSCFAP